MKDSGVPWLGESSCAEVMALIQPKLSPLVRVLPWTHNLLIMSRSKQPEEREFYLRLCRRERWGKRELERQLSGALYERTVLSPPKVSPVVREFYPDAATFFKDTYLFDFLQIPSDHTETDLHREALDRDIRKPHERPSIGVLLCATRDSEVVEYALSRSVSPALITEYQILLPDKKLLRAKLHEYYQLLDPKGPKTGSKKPAGRRKRGEAG
jgi:hypothetical protein